MTGCVNRNVTGVSLLKRDAIDHLKYFALFCILTYFQLFLNDYATPQF